MIILQGYRHHLRGNDGGEGVPISKARASKTGETISVTGFRRTEVKLGHLLAENPLATLQARKQQPTTNQHHLPDLRPSYFPS